jgi:acyl carrier protein
VNDTEIRTRVLGIIKSIAPELEEGGLRADRPLRDQIDLDSMDWLNVLVALHEKLQVDIPEADYEKLASVRSCVDYLAARVRPELASRVHFDGTPAIREDIARTIPSYDGIQRLSKEGDQFQYGGRHLCQGWRFGTEDGKARFAPVKLPEAERPAGAFLVSTRRGKQFNSMVQEEVDPLTGAGRDAVLIGPGDAGALRLAEGDEVVLESERGSFRGRVHLAPMTPGNLQVHWPEGQALIAPDRRGRQSGIPDYNAVVRLRPLPREPA